MEPDLKTGLVLGGGGARGAYEAGIVSYLRDELQPELGRPLRFDILSGTSIGALNASFLASTADTPALQSTGMIDQWRHLKIEEVLSFGLVDVLRLMRDLLAKPIPELERSRRRGGLVDLLGLGVRMLSGVSWQKIGRNLRAGHLDALSVSATHVGSGRTVVFIQTGKPGLPPWTYDPSFHAVSARIGPRHALASAAIPLIFAPVRIGGRLYLDGGLRLNVPLSPALRLGAQRLAIVSLRTDRHLDTARVADDPERDRFEESAVATAPFLFGKTLNAMLLETVEQDLGRMRRLNGILEAGTQAFGPQFGELMNQALAEHRNVPIRPVRNLLVRPSQDIGRLAAQYVRAPGFVAQGGLVRRVLRDLSEREAPNESDLASYLLFDGDFADQLIQLGRADARARREEWLHFWSEAPQSLAEEAERDRRSRAA